MCISPRAHANYRILRPLNSTSSLYTVSLHQIPRARRLPNFLFSGYELILPDKARLAALYAGTLPPMSSFNLPPPAPKPTTYEFVVGQRPDQLNAGSSKKLRSHLSKRGWEVYLEQKKLSSPVSVRVDEAAHQTDDGARRKKRRRHRQAITWDVMEPGDPRVPRPGNVREAMLALIKTGRHMPLERTLSIDYRLGGGRVDPFKSYPTPFRSYIPRLVDHCKFILLLALPF